MTVTYQIAEQTGSTAHFARISLWVAPTSQDGIHFEANEDSIRGWTQAISAGIDGARKELRKRGYSTSPFVVTVLEFVGLATDTRDVEAHWAAFMAVVSSFHGLHEAPLEYQPASREFRFSWPEIQDPEIPEPRTHPGIETGSPPSHQPGGKPQQ